MPRCNLRILVIAAIGLCVSACVTPPPQGNQNAGNNNTNAGNSNANTSSNNTNANESLTLQVIARRQSSHPTLELSSVRVVGFINKGRPERNAVGGLVFEIQASDSAGGGSPETIQIPRGAEITLIADELYTSSLLVNSTSDPFTVSSFTTIPPQFDRWIGAEFATPGADKGVLHFTMDQDRSIEAIFIESNLLSVRCDDPGNGTGTTLDLEIEMQPLNIPPVAPSGASNINIVGSVPGQELGWFGFFNDSAVITMTIPAPAPFTSWSGDGAVSGRTVIVTMEERSVPQRKNLVLTY